MKNFRTYDLAVEFYKSTKTLPLPGYAKNQFARAAHSIVLNLAEGRGRHTVKDQKRFFSISLGSLRECQAILQLEELDNTPEWKKLDKLGAHLFKLIKGAG
jgi:four helix bundle protein